jgi:hypothetical protein
MITCDWSSDVCSSDLLFFETHEQVKSSGALFFISIKNGGITACTHHKKATMEKFASKDETPVFDLRLKS